MLKQISGLELSVLGNIRQHGGEAGLHYSIIADLMGEKDRAVQDAIAKLADKGLVSDGVLTKITHEGVMLLHEFHLQHNRLELSSRSLLHEISREVVAVCLKRPDWPFCILSVEEMSRQVSAGVARTLYSGTFESEEDCWEEVDRWWAAQGTEYEQKKCE